MNPADGKLLGLIDNCVDDCLFSIWEPMINVVKQIASVFYSKKLSWDVMNFIGVNMETVRTANGSYIQIHQTTYITRLKPLPIDVRFKGFDQRGHPLVASLSRPDQYCAINGGSQVTDDMFGESHVKEISKAIEYATRASQLKLKYEPLDRSSYTSELTKTLHLRRITTLLRNWGSQLCCATSIIQRSY